MRVAIIGAGAVGGYYGALLARSGCDVSFVARGTHLDAIRQHGLRVIGATGDFTVHVTAESDPRRLGSVDVVILAVKTYDNASALPLLEALVGAETVVLSLQNGVDSVDELARVVAERAILAGATYIATAIDAPGVIRQTGTHRRIVFGEAFHPAEAPTPRVRAIESVMKQADIHAEAVADGRVAQWEKFVYLAPFAAFTAAARSPIGPLWSDADGRAAFLSAVAEVESVARASGYALSPGTVARIEQYTGTIPPSTRSSLLIDLSLGKRLEVESLPGSVVRRGRAVGVATPMMEALYAVLKPHVHGASLS